MGCPWLSVNTEGPSLLLPLCHGTCCSFASSPFPGLRRYSLGLVPTYLHLGWGILRFLWLRQAVVVTGIFVNVLLLLMSFHPEWSAATIFLHCACSEHSLPLPSMSCVSRRHPELPRAPLLLSRWGPTPREPDHLSGRSGQQKPLASPKRGSIRQHGFRHRLLESWGSSGKPYLLGTLALHPSPGAFLPPDRELCPNNPFSWNLCRAA